VFEVGQSASNYKIAYSGQTMVTPYEGSFLLDPQTADLVHLTVRTAELPQELDACQAISEIEYERIDVHGDAVLVPRETDLHTICRDGKEAESATSYSSCRKYTTKSMLRFDINDLSPASRASQPSERPAHAPPANPFPAGVTFHCRIVTPIDSNTAGGQPIEALLQSPLLGKNGEILAPIGAHIHGRLVRLGEYKGKHNYFTVGVRFDSVEVNGAEFPIYATLLHQAEPPADSSLGDGEQFSDLMTRPRNVGVFFCVTGHLHIRQWDSVWLTTFPQSHKENNADLQPKTPQQASEMEAANSFILAIRYSQQATDLLDALPATGDLASYSKLPDILTYRRKAIAVGESADRNVLNNLFPGLGDRFKDELLEALTLFVHGWEPGRQSDGIARGELSRSALLADEWADWYARYSNDIEDLAKRNSIAVPPDRERPADAASHP
jgi:hypothetical protein